MLNPRSPEPFSVTRPPKGGGRFVATPLPICTFYNKRPIQLFLLPLYSYESPLFTDTKISTTRLRMSLL